MPIVTGDLARSFSMNQAYGKTKQRLEILTREVASRQHADVARTLNGDTRGLSALRHRMTLLDTFRTNLAETGARFNVMQAALANMHDAVAKAAPALLAPPGQGALAADAVLADAEGNLQRIMTALNASQAGEYVFSGASPATPAVRPASAVIDAIAPRLQGLSTAEAVAQAVDQFFSASGGGGYLDSGLSGALQPAGPVHVSPGETVASPVTAASGPLREAVKGALLAVLAGRRIPPLPPDEKSRLVTAAGTRLLSAGDGLTQLRAGQGVLEAQVERARLRNDYERSAVEMAYANIVTPDPYRAAAALSEAQSGLETLYAITARLSRMSLAERL
ncbi:hypothetical protein GI374_04930 [Paracoccus sp. S-4012]|uniref:hypothetical protein n=1 Tax=Paracoccus sp. S-4012 TaxID=2665648 RepID=UPI0012B0A5D9|nr:hypothetical protein [Paracoccus sp. S-4012]MRX49806.1 hypothetical protein [Paracoccus sp. S-4012]